MSVIVPLRNAGATIADQLAGLARQDYPGSWEIVVVDNGSDDEGPAIASGWSDRLPHLRLIRATARRSVSYARNQGVAAARGDVVAICDADDVVAPGWVSAHVAALRLHDIVGGALEFDRFNNGLPLRKDWFQTELPVRYGYLPYASGANCSVRRLVLETIGGWNEDYAGGGDDIEFSWRAHLHGFQLGFAPDAVVHYRPRPTLRALGRQSFGYGRNGPQLVRQFMPHGLVRRTILRKLISSGALLVADAPRAAVDSATRAEFVRRASLAAGWAVGLVSLSASQPRARERTTEDVAGHHGAQ